MFVRICLLSALAMGALAGPAVSADGVSATGSGVRDEPPIVLAQLQRFITPRKPHLQPATQPARPPCPNYFAAC